MQMPIDIRFRDMPHSKRLEEYIRERIGHLEQIYDRITGCHVMLETPHRHHHTGRRFHVRVHVTVPGDAIVVSHDAGRGEEHEEARIAIHQAFEAAERRLEDHVRRMRGTAKRHEEAPHGHIARLFPQDGYGFIRTPDGREVYFHANSVIGSFERLEPEMSVRFAEEAGEMGPQASTVYTV